ncbi:MAG: arsenic transporter [Firmicutes bacterium]|nr:arsenic transporter [Bacillota bacterium]
MVESWILALAAFLVTVVLVLWRPGNIHEAIPALLGAFVMFLAGLITHQDVLRVMMVVWNSAMTIISTFVMASVLEGAGFFRWVGDRLIERADGSGRRLFHLVLAFSACLTLFINNDGSILLGTPIVLSLVQRLRLPHRAAFGYLIGACLIASTASPAIGVSNLANLEAMTLAGISLVKHLEVTLLPAIIGLTTCWGLLYLIFHRTLPQQIRVAGNDSMRMPAGPPLPHPHAPRYFHGPHPLRPSPPPPDPLRRGHHPPPPGSDPGAASPDRPPDFPFIWFGVTVVVLVRIGFYAASVVGIPPYIVAMTGACILLAANAHRRVMDTRAAMRRAPWAILGFAFGMDLVVFGLRNAGLIGLMSAWIGPAVRGTAWGPPFLSGGLTAAVSGLLNNHPGLIIGSLTLLDLHGVTRPVLDVAYSGVVLGADVGALITPVGTLASLIWFHLLRQHGHRYSWWEYVKVTAVVIPLSFVLALVGLYGEALLRGL